MLVEGAVVCLPDREIPTTLHERFEHMARVYPDALAVLCGRDQISYRELNRRSNKLAWYLQNQGVHLETPVGIFMSRGIEMITAILAVLKCGGAYVPLDPTYPAARTQLILDQSLAYTVLTEHALMPLLQTASAPYHVLDDLKLHLMPDIDLPPAAGPENIAYIMYTSGSTGQPKGVEVLHRGVTALITWAARTYSKDDCAQVLASTSICFDLSVFEIFFPLSVGGAIELVENIRDWSGRQTDSRATLVNTVPSAVPGLIARNALPSTVRVLNLAGEPLASALVDSIYNETTVERVYDLYGPTECTVYSTFALRTLGQPATIGRPIDGTTVHLLDDYGKSVSPGQIGEIHIAGEGLARGYRRRPDLTDGSFHYADLDGLGTTRVYKTGDLARLNADGDLIFLGRRDHQVKIRGYRIELGEIEAALRDHPRVSQAVAAARDDSAGDKRLVAYQVSQSVPGATSHELRQFLRTRLPDYMVPSIIVELESFPLTPNGKVDRASLPIPREAHAYSPVEHEPTTELERALMQIWSELLELDQIGRSQDFFELGGDSLMAVRVCDSIQQRLGVRVAAYPLFKLPTIAAQAQLLSDIREERHKSAIHRLRESGSLTPIIFLPDLANDNSIAPSVVDLLGDDRPLYLLLAGEDPLSITDQASKWSQIILSSSNLDNFCLLGYSYGGVLAFELARLLYKHGKSPALLVIIDAAAHEGEASWWRPLAAPRYFAQNLPHWYQHVARPQWKKIAAHRLNRIRRKLKPPQASDHIVGAGIDSIMEVSQLPAGLRREMDHRYRAMTAYQPRAYNKPTLLIAAAARPLLEAKPRDLGWKQYVGAALKAHTLPGSHMSIMREPVRSSLVQTILAALHQIDEAKRGPHN